MLKRDFIKYGVWVVLAVLALGWELIAVKSIRKIFGMPPRDHPTISELVWSFQARFGHAGQGIILIIISDLVLHFEAHTPLIPGVG